MTSNLEILPVRSKREQRAFLDVPRSLYQDDPCWVPAVRQNECELVGYRHHPFYDDAEVQTFLAQRGGEPVGRIAAIVNHAYNRRYGQSQGFFGFFESIDQQPVAAGLLDAARAWLQARGMTAMRGPVNPSLNYECGLLVDGFDTPPFFMMTHHRPYYAALLEASGCRKAQDLYAFWGHVDMIPELSPKHAFMHQAVIERFELEVRQMDTRRFRQDVATFLELYNRSLEQTWGFVPLSAGEISKLAGTLRHLIVPELTRIAEIDGQPIGAMFCLPDYNPRIRAIDGRLWPFGFWKLIRNKKSITRARVLSANVVPEYQRWGVGLMLMREFLQPVQQLGIQELEFSWVLETNDLSRMSLEKGGARRYKTYRIYDRA